MLYMSSQSTSDGNMTLNITFKLGTNLDTAQVLVQNRVAIAIPTLPAEVQRIGVTTKKQSPDITMVVHLVSPDGSLDSLFTSNYALLQIRDELARLDGRGRHQRLRRARIFDADLARSGQDRGARSDRAGRGQRDPGAECAGRRGHHRRAAGAEGRDRVSIYGQHARPAARSKTSSANIVVKTGANGQVTRVRDIARVELAARDYTVNSELGGKPATAIAHFPTPGFERARDFRRRARRRWLS